MKVTEPMQELLSDVVRRNNRERWDVTRTRHTEDRVRHEPWVRQAIYDRDGRACVSCRVADHQVRNTGSAFQLDHIVPWSAGGTDDASNLRTMCGRCNYQRSNHRDVAEERPRLPVTYSCPVCHDLDVRADVELEAGVDLVLAYCATCGGTTWEMPTYVR